MHYAHFLCALYGALHYDPIGGQRITGYRMIDIT